MSFDLRQYEPGTVITEPGAYVDVPMSVYHGQPTDGPSISSSQLRTIFRKSLKHYWDESPLNPNRKEFTDTEATILGRAAHHLLLGEAEFSRYFAIRPELAPDGRAWHGANKSCIEWMSQRELEGITVLKGEQLEQIRGMAETLAAEAPPGILNGLVELSLFWRDEETGVWLKARPDAVPNSSGDAADMKCVADIFDEGIARGLGERGYHQQASLFSEASRHVLGVEMQNFFLVYVEQKRPHAMRVQTIHPDEIAAGIEENRAALRLFARALQTGEWTGPKSAAGDGGFIRRTNWDRERARRRLELINQELDA
jgi:hypothetical protein